MSDMNCSKGNLTYAYSGNRHNKLQTTVNKTVQTAISCPMLHAAIIQFLQGTINEPFYPYPFRYWIESLIERSNEHKIRSPVSEAAVVRNQSLSNCPHCCPLRATTLLFKVPPFNERLSRFQTALTNETSFRTLLWATKVKYFLHWSRRLNFPLNFNCWPSKLPLTATALPWPYGLAVHRLALEWATTTKHGVP